MYSYKHGGCRKLKILSEIVGDGRIEIRPILSDERSFSERFDFNAFDTLGGGS